MLAVSQSGRPGERTHALPQLRPGCILNSKGSSFSTGMSLSCDMRP